MFGFGKKKIDDRMVGLIAVELAMFMQWRKGLNPHEIEDIARRILVRENFIISDGLPLLIGSMALDFLLDKKDFIEESRKKYLFDEQIEKFCKSIGIPCP